MSIETDLPLALENKTSGKLVQLNLNTVHSARETFIKTESSEKHQRPIILILFNFYLFSDKKTIFKKVNYKLWNMKTVFAY